MSRWLRFDDATCEGAKTRTVEVRSVHGAPLGVIKWFGRWRQYAFFPADGTVFNPECLRDICYALAAERRRRFPLAPVRAGAPAAVLGRTRGA